MKLTPVVFLLGLFLLAAGLIGAMTLLAGAVGFCFGIAGLGFALLALGPIVLDTWSELFKE